MYRVVLADPIDPVYPPAMEASSGGFVMMPSVLFALFYSPTL